MAENRCPNVAALLAAFVLLSATVCYAQLDLGSKIIELLRQHRYDDAITAARNGIRGNPRDDAQIYSWLGMIYVTRAHEDTVKRESDLAAGTDSARKSVTMAAADDKALMLYDASTIFESAGDIGTSRNCDYYREAEELLRPLSRESDERMKKAANEGLNRVEQKKTRGGCRD
jgi:hypothetical protein